MSTVKFAVVPLNATAVAPVNPVPVIVTESLTAPLVGVKLVIVGWVPINSKAPMSQPFPCGRVTPR